MNRPGPHAYLVQRKRRLAGKLRRRALEYEADALRFPDEPEISVHMTRLAQLVEKIADKIEPASKATP